MTDISKYLPGSNTIQNKVPCNKQQGLVCGKGDEELVVLVESWLTWAHISFVQSHG